MELVSGEIRLHILPLPLTQSISHMSYDLHLRVSYLYSGSEEGQSWKLIESGGIFC